VTSQRPYWIAKSGCLILGGIALAVLAFFVFRVGGLRDLLRDPSIKGLAADVQKRLGETGRPVRILIANPTRLSPEVAALEALSRCGIDATQLTQLRYERSLDHAGYSLWGWRDNVPGRKPSGTPAYAVQIHHLRGETYCLVWTAK
jgi:hypothetical protein